MSNISACLSHNSDIWETPKNIYNFYKNNNYFDPCPINPQFNGLEIDWKDKNYVNPPYSKLKDWIIKSLYEAQKGKKVVLLIPARTDTRAFKLLVESNICSILLIEGRLKFSNKNSAPFPSMFVFLDRDYKETKIQYLSKQQLIEIFGDF